MPREPIARLTSGGSEFLGHLPGSMSGSVSTLDSLGVSEAAKAQIFSGAALANLNNV
ncbi:MAG: hypothetical protein ACREKH_15785 [Candidatus Rokuibacteriota bacterium]